MQRSQGAGSIPHSNTAGFIARLRQQYEGMLIRSGLPTAILDPPAGSKLHAACEAIAAWLSTKPGARQIELEQLKALEDLVDEELLRLTLGLPELGLQSVDFAEILQSQHMWSAWILVVRTFLLGADVYGRHTNTAEAYFRTAERLGPGLIADDVRDAVEMFYGTFGRLASAHAYRPDRTPDWAGVLSESLKVGLTLYDTFISDTGLLTD